MKKYFIGLLSVFVLLASILGMQTTRTKDRPSDRRSDPAMWV